MRHKPFEERLAPPAVLDLMRRLAEETGSDVEAGGPPVVIKGDYRVVFFSATDSYRIFHKGDRAVSTQSREAVVKILNSIEANP